MIFASSRLGRAGTVLFAFAAVGLACAVNAATARPAQAATVFDSGQAQYGWTTSGLTPGDCDVYVDCGNWSQIIVNERITGPGTLVQLLDYRDAAAPAASSAPANVAPSPSPATPREAVAAASSAPDTTPQALDALVIRETPTTTAVTPPSGFVAIKQTSPRHRGGVGYGAIVGGALVVGISVISAVRRRSPQASA